jgi:hypothetical protein
MEVAVSSSAESMAGPPIHQRRERPSLEERMRRRGIRPIKSVDELARDDIFESDEELDAFLADLYASRRSGLA